jgi:hypothetical protein
MKQALVRKRARRKIRKSRIEEAFMFRSRMLQVWIATVVLSTGMAVVPDVAAGSSQSFTGTVSDASAVQSKRRECCPRSLRPRLRAEKRHVRFGSRRLRVYPHHAGSSRTGRTQQAGLEQAKIMGPQSAEIPF